MTKAKECRQGQMDQAGAEGWVLAFKACASELRSSEADSTFVPARMELLWSLAYRCRALPFKALGLPHKKLRSPVENIPVPIGWRWKKLPMEIAFNHASEGDLV